MITWCKHYAVILNLFGVFKCMLCSVLYLNISLPLQFVSTKLNCEPDLQVNKYN